PYDYKDGLVYVDKRLDGGAVRDSKMLWALGHFARFIRPGARRIGVLAPPEAPDPAREHDAPLVSAWVGADGRSLVAVGINPAQRPLSLKLVLADGTRRRFRSFLTTPEPGKNLAPGPALETGVPWTLPPRSMATWVGESD
ncbi:MAG: hypothetical protein D6766_02460, partial [Verrucomicrobia bacterium]